MTRRDHSAISKKAWRTRKRMQAERKVLKTVYTAFKQQREYADAYATDRADAALSSYRRSLPCPNFGERLK